MRIPPSLSICLGRGSLPCRSQPPRIGRRPGGKDDNVVADIDAVILTIVIFIVVGIVVLEQRRVCRLSFALGDVLRRPVVDVVIVVVAPFSQDAIPAAATRGTAAAISSVADDGIDVDDPEAAAISDDAASSMLKKGNCNKNGTKEIGIQAFDAVLQLGVGYQLMV